MLRTMSRLFSLPGTGRVVEAPFQGLATRHATFGATPVLVITPKILREEGKLFVKDNWVVQNLADPDHFNHFFAHIYRPGKVDSQKPAVILIPGILCNGNLFRMSRGNGGFRSLDDANSFANALAAEGYHVVVIHPRYARWIYNRYVSGKLGVDNKFSDRVDFEKLKRDIPFFIDVAVGMCGVQKAVVAGYSMGGMELLDYLARDNAHSRLAGVVFLATPGLFSREQRIIKFLYYYNWLARLTPLRNYHALNVAARNIFTAKPVLRRLSPAMIDRMDLLGIAEEICNFENQDPETLPHLLSYVLEPVTSPIVGYFQLLANEGRLASCDRLSRVNLPCLFVAGEADRVVSVISARTPYEQMGGSRKEFCVMGEAGHLDLVTGSNSDQTSRRVLAFLDEL